MITWQLIFGYLGGLFTGFAVGIEFHRWRTRRIIEAKASDTRWHRAADEVERRMRTGDQANMNERTPTGFKTRPDWRRK
jgi:hypothetical protein